MLTDADLRFGRCQVNLAARGVWLDGTRQPLPDAAFDFLALLLQRRPQVVSTGELVQRVWHGAPVPDGLLAQTVMQLRAAIGDTRPQPQWLHSVHGVGFRLQLPEPAAAGWASDPATPQPLRLGLLPCVPSRVATLPPGLALGLPALLAEALADEPGLMVVAAAELQALQRSSARRPHAQATVALQACGLDHVLHLGWRTDGLVAVLGWQLRSAAGPGPGGELRGEEALSLAPDLAAAVLQALRPGRPAPSARRWALSADPFIHQAFARGVTLHHQGRWHAAGLAFDLVRQACPDALAPRLWQLRGTVAQGLPQAAEQARTLADKAQGTSHRSIRAEALALRQQALAAAPSQAEREAGVCDAAEALGLLDNQRHEPWAVTLRIDGGLFAAACGHWAQARIWLQQAVDDARAARLPLWLGRALLGRARLERSLGQDALARRHLDEALQVQRSGCDPATRARTLALLALTRLDQGEPGAARALSDEALALMERQPVGERPAEALSALALVHAEQADAAGVDRIAAALGPPAQDPPAARAHRLAVQACAALCAGDGAAASRWLAVALACRGDAVAHGLVSSWLSLLSSLTLVAGVPADALALLPEQDSWLGLPQGQTAHALRLHAEATAAWQAGDAANALDPLGRLVALNAGTRLTGCAQLDQAWLQLALGRTEAAAQALQAAGAWPSEHPAGLAARARLHHAQGQTAVAVHLQRMALRQFQGPPPAVHQALLQAYLAGTTRRCDEATALPVLPVLLSDSWLPASPATTSR